MAITLSVCYSAIYPNKINWGMKDEMLGSKKALSVVEGPCGNRQELFVYGELGDDREIGPDGV